MKKIKLLILTIILNAFLPINIFAYSDYIIPGGESVGIEIDTKGILVVGFYKVDGKLNKGTPNLKVGDIILKVNDSEVDSIEEMVNLMESEMNNNVVTLTFLRDEKIKTTDLKLIYTENTYKTGLYVKDSITGIGTLTYIDPVTRIYGALGHEIIESNTNERVEVKTGTIFRSSITSIDRSVAGTPGGKNAKFYSNSVFGDIRKNAFSGIYGEYIAELPVTKTLKVSNPEEINLGEAYIYTVLNKEDKKAYKINITRVDKNSITKGIHFEVTDRELLEKTGGIVQGMSGSPIIQDDKIIGAVTHVVVSNPSNGYGISIINMLEEGEK